MRLCGHIAFVTLLGFLGGCASTGGFPSDPQAQAAWYVEKAEQRSKSDDFERVAFLLTEAVSKPGGAKAANDWLAKSPSNKAKLTSYFNQKAKVVTNKDEINRLAKYVSDLGRAGVIPDSEQLAATIDATVLRGNSANEINWLLSDDISYLHTLRSPEAQKVIFERSLVALSEKQRPKDLAKALAGYLSKPERTPLDLNYAKQKLAKISLARSEIQEFQGVFPDLVSAKLAELTVYIQVNVTPPDRLMEEDLKEKLRQISTNYVLLKHGEQGHAGTIKIAIEKLRSDERQLASQSQTVTYAQHDVDLMKAALLMPSNASYMYDWKTGGVELEYGYVVQVQHDRKILLDELVRGTLTETFVRCDNPRIVNVFGGTTRADFVANSDMSRKCSGAKSAAPSLQDLRGQALLLLVDKIVSLEPLAARRE